MRKSWGIPNLFTRKVFLMAAFLARVRRINIEQSVPALKSEAVAGEGL